MAFKPTKLLNVDFTIGSNVALWPSGDWSGFAYRWNAVLSVTPQPHSNISEYSGYYNGNNVNSGDFLATCSQGKVLKFVSITAKNANTVSGVVEDYNGENIYQNPNQDGEGFIPDGEGYVFEIVNGTPILSPLPEALPGSFTQSFASDIMARFANHSPLNRMVLDIIPSGDIDGVNKNFFTPNNFIAGTLRVYVNGLMQSRNSHFVESGINSFVLDDAPASGAYVTADYYLT